MKIFDCFTFNNELDILEFRLEQLYESVDQFVLVESRQTHTGTSKPLHFYENMVRFSKWKDKISYFECPIDSNMSSWTYENYQRDYIRQCLYKLRVIDDDIVFISDVDEIINVNNVLKFSDYIPMRIEMPFYYYFSNLRGSEMWDLTICCHWKDIKDRQIGDRLKYKIMFHQLLNDQESKNGGHLSYMFGYSIDRYREKISSFAHGEFNNFYYKNSIRLKYCISSRKDIYERSWINFDIDDSNEITPDFCITRKNIFESYYPINYSKVDIFFINKYIYLLRLFYRIALRLKIVKYQ
jgi:hypothetical protein